MKRHFRGGGVKCTLCFIDTSGRVWRHPCQWAVVQEWKWGASPDRAPADWDVPHTGEPYFGVDPQSKRPLCPPWRASLSQGPAAKQSVGGWTWRAAGWSLKDPAGGGRSRVGEREGWGGRRVGMGYRSVPGLPGLQADRGGMIFSQCLRRFFVCDAVCLCVATPLWGCSDPCRSSVFTAALWWAAHTYTHNLMGTHTHTHTHWGREREKSLLLGFGLCTTFLWFYRTDRHTLGLRCELKLLSNVWQLVLFSFSYDGLITIVWEIMAKPTDRLYVQRSAVYEWLCGSGLY